jgi:hypothetical protein
MKIFDNTFIEKKTAMMLGITQTVLLQEVTDKQTEHYLKTGKEFVPISYEDFQQNLDYLTVSKIQYSISQLVEKGFLEIQNNKRNGKRINEYKVNLDKVLEIVRGE